MFVRAFFYNAYDIFTLQYFLQYSIYYCLKSVNNVHNSNCFYTNLIGFKQNCNSSKEAQEH